MFSFYNKGNYEKAKVWNQICLFLYNPYCVIYGEYPGLKEEHNKIRKRDFDTQDVTKIKGDLNLLIEGDNNTEENRCYVTFYKTQDNLQKYKKEFLEEYPKCRKYYMQNIPTLIEYEENFLRIFK